MVSHMSSPSASQSQGEVLCTKREMSSTHIKVKYDRGHEKQNKKHESTTERKTNAIVKQNLPQQKVRESGSYPRNTINHVSRTTRKLDWISKSPPQAPWRSTSSAERQPKQQQHGHCEPEEEKHLHPRLQRQESPGGKRSTRHSVRDAGVKPTMTKGEATRSRSSPDKSEQHERDIKGKVTNKILQ